MRTAFESRREPLRKVGFAEFRQDPNAAFRDSVLREGIAVHRWERYVVPAGMSVNDVPRDGHGRLSGEVPGDGNVYDHQRHQGELVRKYAPADLASTETVAGGYAKRVSKNVGRDVFLITACADVHDFAEMKHGDTVSDLKHLATHTVSDEIAATKKFVRRALMEKDPRRRRRFERTILRSYAVDHDKRHRLYPLFKLYEKYSYLNGTIAAFDHGRGAVAHSHHLVHNVLKNQIFALMDAYEAKIPSALEFLGERVGTISEMFDWVWRSGFRDPDPKNQDAFERAWSAWSNFCRDRGLR